MKNSTKSTTGTAGEDAREGKGDIHKTLGMGGNKKHSESILRGQDVWGMEEGGTHKKFH